MDKLILVNKDDENIGTEEKIKVHKEGMLHRAFSVLIFNSKGEMLLQKRAKCKYHSGGLWSNACCGHPTNENLIDFAKERLNYEMGFKCDLDEIFRFDYNIRLNNGFIENEIDHVLVGFFNHNPVLNPLEAEDYGWISIEKLKADINQFPEKYTYWFKVALQLYLSHKGHYRA